MNLVLALVFSFSYPSHDACLGCRDTTACPPVRDLSRVRLYAASMLSRPKLLVREKRAGLPGSRDTLASPMNAKMTHWVTAVDSSGNESCFSNPITRIVPIATPLPKMMLLSAAFFSLIAFLRR